MVLQHDTLRSYDFGVSLINWVKTLYSHNESCILNNGWARNFSEIQRGVRQGCPLSPYLFILSPEMLATAIRKNINIKGIYVNSVEINLSQYADDTTLILDGSHESLLSSLAMKISAKFLASDSMIRKRKLYGSVQA